MNLQLSSAVLPMFMMRRRSNYPLVYVCSQMCTLSQLSFHNLVAGRGLNLFKSLINVYMNQFGNDFCLNESQGMSKQREKKAQVFFVEYRSDI